MPSAKLDETFDRLGFERAVERDDHPSDLFDFKLSPKEVAMQNRLEPMRALVNSLVASRETEALIDRMVLTSIYEYALISKHSGSLEIGCRAAQTRSEGRLDAAASRFVNRRGTSAWSTIREVLRRVSDGRRDGLDYRRAVLDLASSTVWVNAPLAGDELTRGADDRTYPRQRGLAKRNREAAAILVARSAGRCSKITTGRNTSGELEVSICHGQIGDYRRGRYCLVHMPQSKVDKRQDRADREAVATLLGGVADSLRVR